MRRLMTGYAVSFNRRHRRAGHLFQNRYKSVVCEEDPYLLELIRYIHLNPLRAGLVKDLKELDKYPWTSHSAILGKRKNPLIPELSKVRLTSNQPSAISSSDERQKSLAEKTVEDILLLFGDTVKVTRRRYRQFISNGIDEGTRPELQGGGLVRSAGGSKAGLLGRKREEREKGDERILGSGNFVGKVLAGSDHVEGPKIVRRIPLLELVDRISGFLETKKDEVLSGNRRIKNCHARDLISFVAAKSMGYKFNDIAALLNIHPVSAGRSAEKGRKLVDNYEGIWDILE